MRKKYPTTAEEDAMQILLDVYFCTDAVVQQYLISFNLLPSDMASVAALYVDSFRGLLFKQQLYSTVLKKCQKSQNSTFWAG